MGSDRLLVKEIGEFDPFFMDLASNGGPAVDRPKPFCYLPRPSKTARSKPLQIIVRDNNIDQALKALKKKMQREGIFREMKLRGHYEKPSEKRARERAEAIRRYRKLQRKRAQREGIVPR
jgi:small subunit ribosomal protein S21